MYCVYLLRCSDDSFSVGSTKNVGGRVRTHDSGRRATYTFKRRLVRLMYTEVFDTETQAIKRERQLKRWSATKKADPDCWQDRKAQKFEQATCVGM